MPESAATAHSTTSVHRGVGSIPEVVRTKRGSPRLLRRRPRARLVAGRSEEHTSELQSRSDLVCRLLLEKKKKKHKSPLTALRTPPNSGRRAPPPPHSLHEPSPRVPSRTYRRTGCRYARCCAFTRTYQRR